LYNLFELELVSPLAALKNYSASEEIKLFGDASNNYFNSRNLVINLG
jgi:hypothetical protein